MALFGLKKKKEEKPAVAEPKRKVPAPSSVSESHAAVGVLRGLHVTEKASLLSARDGVYTFKVGAETNKRAVAGAVARLYKVHPVKVHMVRMPSKRVVIRGKRGVKSGGYKTYVFLKKGEKIEIA